MKPQLQDGQVELEREEKDAIARDSRWTPYMRYATQKGRWIALYNSSATLGMQHIYVTVGLYV